MNFEFNHSEQWPTTWTKQTKHTNMNSYRFGEQTNHRRWNNNENQMNLNKYNNKENIDRFNGINYNGSDNLNYLTSNNLKKFNKLQNKNKNNIYNHIDHNDDDDDIDNDIDNDINHHLHDNNIYDDNKEHIEYGKFNDIKTALNTIQEIKKSLNNLENDINDQKSENKTIKQNIQYLQQNKVYQSNQNNLDSERIANKIPHRRKLGGTKRKFNQFNCNINNQYEPNKKRRITLSTQFCG